MYNRNHVALPLFLFAILLNTSCVETRAGARPGIIADSGALERRLVMLGATGAHESLAFIPYYLYHPSDDLRKAAKKALRTWRKANGQPVEQLPVDWEIDLRSPSPDERGEVCDRIRKSGRAAAAVPHVTAALSRERDPAAQRRMLLVLGASGTPEGRRIIDAMLASPDKETRDSARKAATLWQKVNEPRGSRGALAAGIVAGVLVGLAAVDNASVAPPRPLTPPPQWPHPGPPAESRAPYPAAPSPSPATGPTEATSRGERRLVWKHQYSACATMRNVCRGGYDASGNYDSCKYFDLECSGGLRLMPVYEHAPAPEGCGRADAPCR